MTQIYSLPHSFVFDFFHRTSLWIRNIQMGLPSVVFAFIHSYIKDGERISTHGYFHGYDHIVVFVVFLQAIGGLVIAVVVKYADNILKTFANAVSILTSTLLSMAIFHFRPKFTFVIGAMLVMLSIGMYGKRTTANASSTRFKPKKAENEFQTVGNSVSSPRMIDKLPV